MKKLAVLTALFVLISGFAFAQNAYNHETAVGVMRGNASLIGLISTAAGKNDFPAAAQNLMVMAQGMNKMIAMLPPKGSLEDWQKTLSSFINTAYKGIGACGIQDSAALNAAVNDLKIYMKAGHTEFRF